jgi:hypothetical protein
VTVQRGRCLVSPFVAAASSDAMEDPRSVVVERLMVWFMAVEIVGWVGAEPRDVVISKAVEAEIDQVRRPL